ncbi:MAG TPA: PDZ domain-containing protein [Candidatus Nitrosotalea sp.]|nr:PDZ domain-containing protein [Candidatus Nitrosotalea sp.]
MAFDVFIQPGVGSSDALLDWLERYEITTQIHDVDNDEGALALALALGGGALPVTRRGGRTVPGYDPQALLALLQPDPADEGLELIAGSTGEVVVGRVEAGGPAARLGLQEGDVVAELGGYSVFSPDQVLSALKRSGKRSLRLRVRRGDHWLTVATEEQTAA